MLQSKTNYLLRINRHSGRVQPPCRDFAALTWLTSAKQHQSIKNTEKNNDFEVILTPLSLSRIPIFIEFQNLGQISRQTSDNEAA
jgi:hypothetical protein